MEYSPESRRLIAREPLGLVLTVAPWNYPYLTAVNTVVPALIAGNAVILKAPSQTLLAGVRFAAWLPFSGGNEFTPGAQGSWLQRLLMRFYTPPPRMISAALRTSLAWGLSG